MLTCGRCSRSVHLESSCVGFLTECQECRANVVGITRCRCHCRAGVFGCHHGDGHASPLISVLGCECRAFQGHSRRLCVETQHVDLLILAFRAALPFTAPRVHTKSSHKPTLTLLICVTIVEGLCVGSVLAVGKRRNKSLSGLG